MSPETQKTVETPVGRICFHVSEGERSRPAALLWPSLFTNGHAAWAPQLDTLQALGLRTIVIDPPGHGRSGPPPAAFSIRQCSEAAQQIMDSEGVGRAVFLGVSWGSFVAMQTAIMAPDRIASLVLSNTTAARGTPMEQFRNAMNCRLIRMGLPGGVGRLVVAGLLGKRFRENEQAFTARLIGEVDSLDRRVLARAARAVLVDREDLTADLHRISAPTMVVTGACDIALPPKYGERVAAGIAGARYETIPGVGHIAPREDSSTFASLLTSFLGRPATLTSKSSLEPA